jgi:hypothetical protein
MFDSTFKGKDDPISNEINIFDIDFHRYWH